MVGYSGTPLPQKLGIKEASRVALVGAPAGFDLGVLPTGAVVTNRIGKQHDVIVAFVTVRGKLADVIDKLRPKMTDAAGLWIAWPKKASGVATDMTEQA